MEGLRRGPCSPAGCGRLAKTLVTSNPAESMISIARTTNRNVTRWRDGHMVLRWTAAGVLNAERSFRRIKGYKQMPQLAADAALAARIRAVHRQDKTYGAPRVTAELNDGAAPEDRINHKRIARVMHKHGIAGVRLRRRVRTTVPEPSGQTVPDLLKRDFTAAEPNRKYVGDITYLPLACGKNLYLATVIDCCSRRVAGWALADHMRTDLIQTALADALATRGSLAGAIFHSDHGSQHLQGLREALHPTRRHPVHGSCRDQRRQRPRRGVQRHPQARAAARRLDLARRAHLPPRDLPLGHPL